MAVCATSHWHSRPLAGVALAGPIAAVEARLTSLPLGRGTAVITRTGTSEVTPTVSSIEGRVGR